MNRTIWARDLQCAVRTPGICDVGGGASGGASSGKQEAQQAPVENSAFPIIRQNVARATQIADTPYQPYDSNTTVAGVNPTLGSSWDMFRGVGANKTGGATLDKAIGNTSAINGGDLSGFMNPYQKQVTDATMADLERSRQIASNADTQRAQAAGAWGGSRSGVAQSLTNDAHDRNAASILAGLNLGNFNNAQNMALQSGAQFGALSDQELQQALTRGNAENTAGTQERSIQQQLDDAAYQEFLRQINQPYQGQQLVTQAAGLLPGGISNAGTSSGKQSSWNAAANVWI